MDTSSGQAWSRPLDHVDPMAQMDSSLPDLDHLFEFGGIDLDNIPAVDAPHYDDHMQPMDTHPHTPFDETSEAHAMAGTGAQDFGAHQQFGITSGDGGQQQQDHHHHHFNGHGQTSNPYTQDAVFQQQMQGFHSNQQLPYQATQAFPPHQHVPPTPNSFEMHGEAGRFIHQQMDLQQRAVLEQSLRIRKEHAITFTPVGSPAGTPHYNVPPEFTIPGAFSPLTSPMLEAQSGHVQYGPGYYTNPSTAPSSNATSPLNPTFDVDMIGDELSLTESVDSRSRRPARRKVLTPRSADPLARVKQSPIQKASKRKSGIILSSLAPTLELDDNLDVQRSKSAQPSSAGLHMLRNDSSENGSISPEPLSEALMRPPPRPCSSKTQSPAMSGQQKLSGPNALGEAATPKSLLSMRGGPQVTGSKTDPQAVQGSNGQAEFEDIQLPAAAAPSPIRPSLSQINTQIASTTSTGNTPLLSARKTPKLGAQGTHSSAPPPSAAPSPSLVGSPAAASTPGALLKNGRIDGKGGRGHRPRGSMSSSSTLLSPALRPKISPSIKPLLPEGASLHSPTHTLLLATKSNYQNLLEGNHLPGVNYPDSLSTGLTSKRTSHKVAEQGRRNRINEALKEMQALLPKGATAKAAASSSSSLPRDGDHSPDADEKDPDAKEESAAAKSNNSKAATVECANEYIRRLQKENAAVTALRQENEAMRNRLRLLERAAAAAAASASPSPPAGAGSSPAVAVDAT